MTDILSHSAATVMTLTFNRPAKKNAITAAMYTALADSLAAASRDDSIAVVLVQGSDSIFSAGNDIEDFLAFPPDLDDAPVFRFLRALVNFDKPLVAAVAGPAVGIGTTLLLHCDLVYAADNARFSMPFVNLGLCPEAGSSLLAPQLMGHQRAAEALLLGASFDAPQALHMGLVNQVVAVVDLKVHAATVAQTIAAKPMASLLATKQLMKQGQRTQLLAQIDAENQQFRQLLQAPAARAALQAFVAKRAP